MRIVREGTMDEDAGCREYSSRKSSYGKEYSRRHYSVNCGGPRRCACGYLCTSVAMCRMLEDSGHQYLE